MGACQIGREADVVLFVQGASHCVPGIEGRSRAQTASGGNKISHNGNRLSWDPHRGSNKAKWASIATNFAAAVLKNQNDNVIEALSRGAEALERVQTSFSRILISLSVYTFVEDRQYEKTGKVRGENCTTGVFINWLVTIDRR